MNLVEEKYQRAAKVARVLWTIHAAIFTVFVLGFTIGIYLIVYKHVWIFAITATFGVIQILVLPAIEYRQWRYFIGDDRIEIVHGIFFVKRVLIPINRIQHLKIRQGFLQKKFNLSTIDIYTAGGAHQIEALLYHEADDIVLKLNHLVAAENKVKNESDEGNHYDA